MGAIKAIETSYKGYRFRSRLEARWAVFFDALGIKWEYEAEGFDLGEAGWYLPDFWLPELKLFAEVKAGAFTEIEYNRLSALSRMTGFGALMLSGVPDNRWYTEVKFHRFPVNWGLEAFVANYEVSVTDTYLYSGLFPQRDYEESQRGTGPDLDESGEVTGEIYNFRNPGEAGLLSESTKRAYSAARSARFEHGEQP